MDSNVLIRGCFPGIPEQKFILKHLTAGNLHTSVLNVAEVLVGADEKEAEKLEAIFSYCAVHALDEAIARQGAELRRRALKSVRVYLIDCCIAASARAIGATVVTNNTKDFVFSGTKTLSP